jgi:deoxyadenosine/deoxycytidine kinase
MANKNFIAIAGNIGVGKSTLTKKLAEHLKWKAYQEPVAQNPYLEDFYKDMKKWGFHSQMYFLGKRLKDHYDILQDKRSVVQDRTIYENSEIFARNLHNRGYINSRDWKVYQQIYKTCTKVLPAPDLVIYLKASVDNIMERIAKRGRDFEKTIDKKYIKELNDLYDRWAGRFNDSQVIILSYDDLDLKNNTIDFDSFLKEVKHYIK